MICVFFGHRSVPDAVREKLRALLPRLVETGMREFLVGDCPGFDRMVLGELRKLAAGRPDIRYAVVLARLPAGKDFDETETLFPEGAEKVPPRFAVDRRNRRMLRQADTVVCYVRAPGGAAKWREAAIRAGKTVIDL